METTISVKESTAHIDEAINKLLQKTGEIEISRFGSQPKLREFNEKDRSVFREL